MPVAQVTHLQPTLAIADGERLLDGERLTEPNQPVEASMFSAAGGRRETLWGQLLSGKTSGYVAIPER